LYGCRANSSFDILAGGIVAAPSSLGALQISAAGAADRLPFWAMLPLMHSDLFALRTIDCSSPDIEKCNEIFVNLVTASNEITAGSHFQKLGTNFQKSGIKLTADSRAACMADPSCAALPCEACPSLSL
jgi:hypothetical protein